MWPKSEIARVVELLRDQVGKKYAIGSMGEDGKWITRGKPDVSNKDPHEFECSGLSRWIIAQGRDRHLKQILLPHGSYNQIKVCTAVGSEKWMPLDLGFSDSVNDSDDKIDHVIIRINEKSVIEARGKPFNGVVQRPVSAWEAHKGFFGWWRVEGLNS